MAKWNLLKWISNANETKIQIYFVFANGWNWISFNGIAHSFSNALAHQTVHSFDCMFLHPCIPQSVDCCCCCLGSLYNSMCITSHHIIVKICWILWLLVHAWQMNKKRSMFGSIEPLASNGTAASGKYLCEFSIHSWLHSIWKEKLLYISLASCMHTRKTRKTNYK